jgi:[acyl-carrier-protein] S-malonyltransferase
MVVQEMSMESSYGVARQLPKRIAVVFAGQGTQYPGMGKSLYESSAAARAVFDAAGEKVTNDCFNASREELNMTDVTQPAVYAVDMAAWAAFAERLNLVSSGQSLAFPDAPGVTIVGMAGFSLGEYAAFTAAGVIPGVASGIEFVKERGRLMSAAGVHADGSLRGAMAAVIGDRSEILGFIDEARGERVLEAVNFNAPTQTSIAGDIEAIDEFAAIAKARGSKMRVIRLPVSTAFHSPIMEPAVEGVREAASKIAFGAPSYELYLDMTADTLANYMSGARPGKTPADARAMSETMPDIMARQVVSPVKWQGITEALVSAGAEVFVEFGPGRTLTGFVRKTAPKVKAVNVQDAESLEAAIDALRE